LDEVALLTNLQKVQTRGGIAPDTALQLIEGEIEVPNGTKKKTKVKTQFPNFSVEMETGTGKTYVYLRTALELYQRYGMRKFIVVVPSVAVREGVLTTLRQTKKHFEKLFDNTPFKFSVYNGANLSHVANFARSENVEFLVMTIDSFAKADLNVIYRAEDKLGGETPLHLIQAARPILLLDEPQNMESEKRVAALAALNPLFALRFSATHRNPYNLVHRLTPYDAYRLGLVKHIEVASVLQDNDFNHAFVRVESIATAKNTITARISVHQLMLDGTIKEKTHTFKHGDNLRDKANRPDYDGYVITEINPRGGFVEFENGLEIQAGIAHGVAKDQIFEAQIRYTVREHLKKQERLRAQGIKVLSLFFIDRVANYRAEDGGEGKIAEMFARAFDEIKLEPKFAAHWSGKSAKQVQAAYFATRKKSKDEEVFEDSTNGKAKKDEAAYDLIMRAKEKLLSFEEPVAFLFSHSALREGWDNPNVFQICTLNQTVSDMKKRQEVGRGVRLARGADGELVRDEKVNILTVVANQSYEAYVETLQKEITDEYGESAKSVPIARAQREKATATLRPLDPEFLELWDKIKRKTRYSVHIDTPLLIAEVVAALNQISISPPRISAVKARIDVGDEDELLTQEVGMQTKIFDLSDAVPSTDLIATMLHLLEFTTPRMCLSRKTLLEIIKKIDNTEAALANPQEFALKAVEKIKGKLAEHLINGIQYHETGEWFDQSILETVIESNAEKMVASPKGLYDKLVFDSQVERKFVQDMEKLNWLRRYIKLPPRFTVPTPIGTYNPDWAIIAAPVDEHGYVDEDEDAPALHLIRETKSSLKPGALRAG
jgi:type III restriction enzyme